MTRQHLEFRCEGKLLVGTLDQGEGNTGFVIVSGGNEIRCGAFAGQARLAAEVAALGYPVLRYDRRGIGDSEGDNLGFRHSGPDIEAALAAFRSACPTITRIVAFGNCDAASALMLHPDAGFDALLLSNPWTIEDEQASPPPEAIRGRYARKLRDPRELVRLFTGKVSFSKLASGLKKAAGPPLPPTSLAAELRSGLDQFRGPVRILLAGRDRTAQVFAAGWDASDPRVARFPDASHAWVEPDAHEWLVRQIADLLGA